MHLGIIKGTRASALGDLSNSFFHISVLLLSLAVL